jgi:di/tricarboxylate transporter
MLAILDCPEARNGTNLMIMGPGDYKFGDYWRLGLPLMLWFFVVSTFYVPLIWRF